MKTRGDRSQAKGIGLPDEFEVVRLIGVGEVSSGEVLRLEPEDGNQSAGAMLLAEDCPPACLTESTILLFFFCLFELVLHHFDASIDVGISAKQT